MTSTETTVTETTVAYASAVNQGRTAVKNMETASWKLGDLASNVELKHGAKTLQKLADDISAAGRPLPYKTLLNFRTTAEKYAPAERTGNHFTVHAAFNGQDDRVKLVNSRSDWTLAEARKLVSERKAAAKLAEAGNESGNESGGESVPAESDALMIAIAKRDALRAELATVEAEIKAIEDSRGIVPAPAGPAVHSVAGIPSHTVAEPHAACPDCKLAGVTPITAGTDNKPAAGSPRRARKPAAARKAS